VTECPNCHAILPQPPERFCANCGADLPAMGGGYTPPPGGGYPPGYGLPPGGGTPWERRDQIGFVTALIETTKQVLSGPTSFFQQMPIAGGLGGPLLYAVIVGYIGIVASTIYNAVFRSVLGSSLARMGGGGSEFERLAPFLQGGASLVVNLIFGPAFVVIGLFIGAGIFHLVLLAVAGGGRGFEATFRVVAYSQAASLFNILPVCGGLVGGIYAFVLLIIGISEAHQITRGRAAAVVLIPLVIVCCCCGGVIAAIVFGVAGAIGHAR
jgi:hypothetical protein